MPIVVTQQFAGNGGQERIVVSGLPTDPTSFTLLRSSQFLDQVDFTLFLIQNFPISPGGAAGGDLGGNYPDPIVEQSSASEFQVVNRLLVNDTTILDNGGISQISTDGNGSIIIGSNATIFQSLTVESNSNFDQGGSSSIATSGNGSLFIGENLTVDGMTTLDQNGTSTINTDGNGNMSVGGGLTCGNSDASPVTPALFGPNPGAPTGSPPNGSFYFRSDSPGTALQRIYVRSAGTWVGIL
jgi:hypothetical protein